MEGWHNRYINIVTNTKPSLSIGIELLYSEFMALEENFRTNFFMKPSKSKSILEENLDSDDILIRTKNILDFYLTSEETSDFQSFIEKMMFEDLKLPETYIEDKVVNQDEDQLEGKNPILQIQDLEEFKGIFSIFTKFIL